MKETAAVFMDCLASLVASVSSTTYAITQMQLLSTLQKWVKLLKKRKKIEDFYVFFWKKAFEEMYKRL